MVSLFRNRNIILGFGGGGERGRSVGCVQHGLRKTARVGKVTLGIPVSVPMATATKNSAHVVVEKRFPFLTIRHPMAVPPAKIAVRP